MRRSWRNLDGLDKALVIVMGSILLCSVWVLILAIIFLTKTIL